MGRIGAMNAVMIPPMRATRTILVWIRPNSVGSIAGHSS